MAKVLQITDETATVNLLNASGICLREDGWETQTAYGAVWETIDVIANALDATIRSSIDTLDDLRDDVRMYHNNPLEETPVWFYWQSEGESVKRALILEIQHNLRTWIDNGPLLGGNLAPATIAIKRTPHFEKDTATTVSTTGVSALGGIWTIANPAGTLPQRIGKLQVETSDVAYAHQQFWFGIRPTYKGTSSFVALWEAENGTTANNTTSQVDAGASGGTSLITDFSQNSSEGARVLVTIGDIVGSNYDHFVGKYLILGRLKTTDGTTQVAVDLRQYWQGSHYKTGLVYIDGETSYTLFPLGEIMMPPTGNRSSTGSSATNFNLCGFRLHATRVSGSGNLEIDCFILVPTEHLITVQGGQVLASDPDILYLYTDPDDHQWGLGESTLSQGGLRPSFNDWYYPRLGGIMVVVSQADTGSFLSKTLDLDIDLYPRYASFRS